MRAGVCDSDSSMSASMRRRQRRERCSAGCKAFTTGRVIACAASVADVFPKM